MDFVSVERVVDLLHLEQEPPGTVDPPAWWPSYSGNIVFENVTIRYAPHLDPSLMGISFHIPAGSTTALLGRTGMVTYHTITDGSLAVGVLSGNDRFRQKHIGTVSALNQ